MSTIYDLPIKNFSNLDDSESKSLILHCRERRRNPDKKVYEQTVRVAKNRAKYGKSIALTKVSDLLKGMSESDKAKALEQLIARQ